MVSFKQLLMSLFYLGALLMFSVSAFAIEIYVPPCTAGDVEYKYTANGCSYITQTRTCCGKGMMVRWSNWGESCPQGEDCSSAQCWDGISCVNKPSSCDCGGGTCSYTCKSGSGWQKTCSCRQGYSLEGGVCVRYSYINTGIGMSGGMCGSALTCTKDQVGKTCWQNTKVPCAPCVSGQLCDCICTGVSTIGGGAQDCFKYVNYIYTCTRLTI